MKLRKKSAPSELAVDISPLIDMVFILLIFFMVSTTFDNDMKVELERPGASSATVASTKAIKVFIDTSSQVFIDGQPVRTWVLQGKVRDMLKSSGKDRSVLVVPDKGIPSEKLIEVIDQVRLAGAKDIGVATKLEAGI